LKGDVTATADQARALDDAAGQVGVSSDALMAIASFQCARLAQSLLDDLPGEASVAVLAGRGNNGGDALGCARHLAAWGCRVRAVALGDLADPEAGYSRQTRAAQAAGVELPPANYGAESAIEWALAGAGLIVDGLLGTGSSGPVRGPVAEAVHRINTSAALVLAIDVPSGLDATTGEASGDCVRADVTLMLAVPKSGCLAACAHTLVGRLWLADIGVPAAAYREAGLRPPHFSGNSLEPFEAVVARESS
jgi:NAD(P)H-hydrate epimerase